MLSLKRLVGEFRDLVKSPADGLVAGPVSGENFYEWEALFLGPVDTCYEYGAFKARISFPKDYPHNPPKMVFTTPIWHPNIYWDGTRAGEVCISILHPPGDDRWGYESAVERWSPVQSVEKILLSVISMLSEPNTESPANIEAGKMWRNDRERYERIVRKHVKDSLFGSSGTAHLDADDDD